MRKTIPRAPYLAPPPPVGCAVYSLESGWTGTVVRHSPACPDDRPHPVIPVVKWDRNGVETRVRPGSVRAYDLESRLSPDVHEGRLAIHHLKNLVRGETCHHWQSRALRPDGETCSEYRSRTQGTAVPGCSHCQAVEFLKVMDPSFDPDGR